VQGVDDALGLLLSSSGGLVVLRLQRVDLRVGGAALVRRGQAELRALLRVDRRDGELGELPLRRLERRVLVADQLRVVLVRIVPSLRRDSPTTRSCGTVDATGASAFVLLTSAITLSSSLLSCQGTGRDGGSAGSRLRERLVGRGVLVLPSARMNDE
jgi:hypothetical protein